MLNGDIEFIDSSSPCQSRIVIIGFLFQLNLDIKIIFTVPENSVQRNKFYSLDHGEIISFLVN